MKTKTHQPKPEKNEKMEYTLIGGIPHTYYNGTEAFQGLRIVATAERFEEIRKIASEKYDECGGLLLALADGEVLKTDSEGNFIEPAAQVRAAGKKTITHREAAKRGRASRNNASKALGKHLKFIRNKEKKKRKDEFLKAEVSWDNYSDCPSLKEAREERKRVQNKNGTKEEHDERGFLQRCGRRNHDNG